METRTLVFFAIIFGILYFGFSAVQATETISNYIVPSTIPLNQNLTIYGTYESTTSSAADVLCSFFVFDVQNLDTNQLIVRLDDIYTNQNGTFTNKPFEIKEPLFRRGIDYNAITECGTTKIGKVFHINQKEDIAFGILPASLIQDFKFWVDPQNSLVVAILLFFLIVGIVIVSPLIQALRGR